MGEADISQASVEHSGARGHFQKKAMQSSSIVSNLLPKTVDLKKSTRDNDCVSNGGRIWVGWDPSVMNASVLHISFQAIFLEVSTSIQMNFIVTFVYGDNYYMNKRNLWASLEAFAEFNSNHWLVNCIQSSQLFDLPFTDCFYTWNNCQMDGSIIRSKIDRVIINTDWIHHFILSTAEFLVPGISDHRPCIISIFEKRRHGPPPFIFYNFLTEEPEFIQIVHQSWDASIRGNPMFQLVSKVKRVKQDIILWKKVRFKKLSDSVLKDKEDMECAQFMLQNDPLNSELARRERAYVRSKNNILSLYNADDVKLEEDNDIAAECITYYTELFNPQEDCNFNEDWFSGIEFNSCIQQIDVPDLVKEVTREEVVFALACIGSNKASGPDGFSSHFFKASWEVVGDAFVAAIQFFFIAQSY
ncbi:uncharacterized protein LOC113359951 [Papaver somniferum]|uniref:uncharacterized protein LOC113359951 n=1 Tax=Papaver somniferum TaxID=3469 RepID=UPI000E6FD322|nr:uncharacterized protein LOC113359951 [Papaver somniferum]